MMLAAGSWHFRPEEMHLDMRPNISVSGLGEIGAGHRTWAPIGGCSTKAGLQRLDTTVGPMASGIGMGISYLIAALALALLTLGLARAQGGSDLELDYSNEYDDVRPHLVYPDVPRLDKRIGNAAREFGQNITQAWQSMVDSFKNYFEELKNLFAPDPSAENEVFSASV